jgi:hypothetical protein
MRSSAKAIACPNCGALPPACDETGKFKCGYCGAIAFAETGRSGEPGPDGNVLGLAEQYLQVGNLSEAYLYFSKYLEKDPRCSDAWFGKAICTGGLSPLANNRLIEMFSYAQSAIDCADEKDRDQLKSVYAPQIESVILVTFNAASDHLRQFASVTQAWVDYLSVGGSAVIVLGELLRWQPRSADLLISKILIIQKCYEGISYYDSIKRRQCYRRPSEAYAQVLREQFAESVQEMKKIKPEYTPPHLTMASGCFVVSAACSSTYAIDTLRWYRDTQIANLVFGQQIIELYGKYGPVAAAFVARARWRKLLSRILIICPLVVVASVSIATSGDSRRGRRGKRLTQSATTDRPCGQS